jgi:hypothetical protein
MTNEEAQAMLKVLAGRAIQCQDAVNPLGLTKAFAEDTKALADCLQVLKDFGTQAICQHPIFQLWASKLHDLAGMGLSDTERFSEAYGMCLELAK